MDRATFFAFFSERHLNSTVGVLMIAPTVFNQMTWNFQKSVRDWICWSWNETCLFVSVCMFMCVRHSLLCLQYLPDFYVTWTTGSNMYPSFEKNIFSQIWKVLFWWNHNGIFMFLRYSWSFRAIFFKLAYLVLQLIAWMWMQTSGFGWYLLSNSLRKTKNLLKH